MSESIDLPGRYADPELKASSKPAEISNEMLADISEEIAKIRFTDDDILIFLGEHLTEPKPSVFFSGPEKPLTPKRFHQAAIKNGLKLSNKSQMLYKGKHVFINGESFAVNRDDKISLNKLANERQLDGADLANVSADVLEAFCLWYEDGWLEIC
jgi:50S ribosomal protein L16 3-hydroxylase